jgi:hypothetical protein
MKVPARLGHGIGHGRIQFDEYGVRLDRSQRT